MGEGQLGVVGGYIGTTPSFAIRQAWFGVSHSLKHAAEAKCFTLTCVVPCLYLFLLIRSLGQ